MMNNKVKQRSFMIMDLLPDEFGYFLYHQIQKSLFKNIESKILANEKSTIKILKTLSQYNKTIESKNLIEIGSGWMPMMPYFLKYMGKCNEVYTYDINEHYDNAYISKLNNYFYAKYNVSFSPGNNFKKYILPDFISYFPKNNVIYSSELGKVDFIFSRYVLEHVSPEDILAMHQELYNKVNINTSILHLISPNDHRAYSDPSISQYDFLKYSQQEWDKIQTKFDYHNRMRLPDYIKIFNKSGFEVIHIEHDNVNPNSKVYSEYKKLKIHEGFRRYSENELLAGSINVLLMKV